MARLVLPYFVLDTANKLTLTICDSNTIIDIDTRYTISFNFLTLDHIRKMIWNTIKRSEESAGKACELKLYKIKIPCKEKKLKLKTLNENYRKIFHKEIKFFFPLYNDSSINASPFYFFPKFKLINSGK